MTFGIVLLLVVAAVFGAAAWIRPSPREKQLSELRTKAIQLGMRVSIKPPQWNEKKSGVRDIPKLTAYIVDRPKPDREDQVVWQVGKLNAWFDEGLPESWKWLSEQPDSDLVPEIAQLISRVPDSVVAVERQPQFSAVYWQEFGKPVDVEEIKAFLANVS